MSKHTPAEWTDIAKDPERLGRLIVKMPEIFELLHELNADDLFDEDMGRIIDWATALIQYVEGTDS